MSDHLEIQNADPFALEASEKAGKVAWVIQQIAASGWMPQQQGPWANRDSCIAAVSQKFEIPFAEACNVVDGAVAYLWSQDRPDDSKVMKRLLLERFQQSREQILRCMKEGKIETTYQISDIEKNGRRQRLRKPVKEKITLNDPAVIGRLIECDAQVVRLLGLEGGEGDGGNMMAMLIEHLDKTADGTTSKRVVASISQRVQSASPGELNEAGQAMIAKSLAEVQDRKKKVHSREVVEGEKADG